MQRVYCKLLIVYSEQRRTVTTPCVHRMRHTAPLSCHDRRPCNERIKLNRRRLQRLRLLGRCRPANALQCALGAPLAQGRLMMWCLMSLSVYRRRRARGHVTSGHVTYVSRETARITNWIRYLRHRHPAVSIRKKLPMTMACRCGYFMNWTIYYVDNLQRFFHLIVRLGLHLKHDTNAVLCS